MLLVFHGLRRVAREKKVVAIWRASKYLIVPSPPHSQPARPLPSLSLCFPELLLLRNLSVCAVGTEVRVMAEVGAEEITTSYWSLANKLSQDWLIKSESKHRH